MPSRSSTTSSPRFLKAFAHNVGMRSLTHLASVLILALAVLTTALNLFALQFSLADFDTLELPGMLTIHLNQTVEQADAEVFFQEIQQRSLGKAELISPHTALIRLAEELTTEGEPLNFISKNPLPWTVEVAVSLSNATADDLEKTSQELRRHPAVADVEFGRAYFEQHRALITLIQRLLWFTFFLSLAFALTASALCLRLVAPAFPSPDDPRNPLLHIASGIFLGITASILSFAGFWATDVFILPALNDDLNFIFHVRGLPYVFSTRSLLGALCLGLSLGLFGSVVSMKRR